MTMSNVASKLDAVPLNMLRIDGEAALKNVRKAHGDVLRRAAQVAGYESDKELAAALGDVSRSQLSAWFSGDENPQTWRFERHSRLGPALLVAQAEAQGQRVEVRTVITLQQKVG